MKNKNSQIIITLQIVISFVLALFGNKMSELFSLKPLYIILIVIFLLILTIILSFPKQKIVTEKSTISSTIPPNKTLIVPIFFLFGLIVSAILILLFKSLNITAALGFTIYFSDENGYEFYAYLYEILSYLLVAILVYLTRKINLDFQIILISLLGASAGIVVSIFSLKPSDNTPLETFIGGFICCIVIVSLIEFIQIIKLQIKK